MANVTLNQAMTVKKRHTDELMRLPGVVGVGVNVSTPDHPRITVLLKSDRPSFIRRIPAVLEDVPVMYQVTGQPYAVGALAGDSPSLRGNAGHLTGSVGHTLSNWAQRVRLTLSL